MTMASNIDEKRRHRQTGIQTIDVSQSDPLRRPAAHHEQLLA
jgi:hypothetical protein